MTLFCCLPDTPQRMSCSWEKRLAENLTNADHMRDTRKRIDAEHEERLRMRERDREDAEVRRAARKVKTTPSVSDKFKTRSYDRPWAVGKPATRKTPSSTSDSSNTSSRNSGSRLPDITNRAPQSSETRTPQTTKQHHKHNKHFGNKCLSKDDSLSTHNNKCVRAKSRKPLAPGSSACYQEEDRFQYSSSEAETSPSAYGQSKPPLTRSREPPPPRMLNLDQRLTRAWPRLPSLGPSFSWTSSESSDTGRQSFSNIWDLSDDSSSSSSSSSGSGSTIREEEEEGEEGEEEEETDDSSVPDRRHGISSSIFSARSVSTDSCLSSDQPTESPLSTPISFSSSSSTSMSLRGPVLDLSPRTRASSLDALLRDPPCLEPITSESEEEEEEELEEELRTWQAGRRLGRGTGVVRWRGPLSRPYLVPLSTASVVSSRVVIVDEPTSRDATSPRGAPARRTLDGDAYAAMPMLEPIPELSPAASDTPAFASSHFSSHLDPLIRPISLEPVPRNEPPWLGRLSAPGASPLQAGGGGAQGGDGDGRSSSVEGTESGTESPPPAPRRVASRVEALAIMDQLGMALVAMREMRRELQGIHRVRGHGNHAEAGSGSTGNNSGNDSGNNSGNDSGNNSGNNSGNDSGNNSGNNSGNGHGANQGGSASADGNTASAPEVRPQADPETLRRITQSLLEESDEEEEGDQCRICQCGGGSLTNPLLSPCHCSGSLQYIHHDCLKKWIETKIESGAYMPAVTTCELCKGTLKLDLNDFDLDECFRRNAQVQRGRGSPDLHLLLLLQERFSGLMMAIQAHNSAVAQDLRQRRERRSDVDRAVGPGRGTRTLTTRGWTSSDSESQSPL